MNNIDPKIWGSSAWLLLHDISFYIASVRDEKIMKQAKEFFMILRHILPCERCQVSYDIHLLYLPFPKKMTDMPKWVFDLHNRVNNTRKESADSPIWNTWQKTYQIEMEHHTMINIWPFIQSIATIYPHSTGYDQDIYKESVKRFFELLFIFLKNLKGYSGDILLLKDIFNQEKIEDSIGSRIQFQNLVTSAGRKIHAQTINHNTCEEKCKM